MTIAAHGDASKAAAGATSFPSSSNSRASTFRPRSAPSAARTSRATKPKSAACAASARTARPSAPSARRRSSKASGAAPIASFETPRRRAERWSTTISVWRGLEPLASKSLRFSPDEPFYRHSRRRGRGTRRHSPRPCMVAAITRRRRTLRWRAPHLARPAPRDSRHMHPARAARRTSRGPMERPAKPKKMRGVKQGGAIRLNEPSAGAIHVVLLCGEGIETTARPRCRPASATARRAAYVGWAAGDLGNLAGGGLGPSTPHPRQARPMDSGRGS